MPKHYADTTRNPDTMTAEEYRDETIGITYGMISDKHRAWIDRSVLCWLATVSTDGSPSVSPKEIFVVQDDRVLIANIASANSARNIQQNSRVCVAFLDVFSQKGVQIYGVAEVVKKIDSRFANMAAPLLAIAGEAFPFASLFLISIERAKPVIAPRYRLYPQTTETQQIEIAMETYGVLPKAYALDATSNGDSKNSPTGACAMRTRVASGSTFEEQIGYSRAVLVGDTLFVSGTTGYDYTTMSIEDDVVSQTEQCIVNLRATLRAAGGSLADVVRVRYMLTDARDFQSTWPTLRAAFGEVRPAATMIECGLADPLMKIEIEVDAIIGSGQADAKTVAVGL